VKFAANTSSTLPVDTITLAFTSSSRVLIARSNITRRLVASKYNAGLLNGAS
jgi:hypothetical protein